MLSFIMTSSSLLLFSTGGKALFIWLLTVKNFPSEELMISSLLTESDHLPPQTEEYCDCASRVSLLSDFSLAVIL